MGVDTKFLMNNLAGFVPVEIAADIVRLVTRGSSVIRLSRVERMKSETKKFPVMTKGPGAYWVGEAERIQTSTAEWIFPEIAAKKLGVIIPVTKEKLKDTTINVFEELKPTIAEAFYVAIDAACLFGTNSPFAKSIYGVATGLTPANAVTVGANDKVIQKGVKSDDTLVDLLDRECLDLDISDTMAKIEEHGFDVNGFSAHYGMKNSLRKLRDANGNQLYVAGVDQSVLYELPIEFSRNSAFDKTKAELIAGDWSLSIVGIRAGIEYEVLREATLHTVTMTDGKPLALAEQDMIALKATMRLGFLPLKEEAFAVLKPRT